MPGGQIIGFAGGIGGNWPGGRGTAGWYMRSSDAATLISSLPHQITSVPLVPNEPRNWTDDTDTKWLALPPGDGSGGRTLSNWVRSSNQPNFTFELAGTTPLLVAQYTTSLSTSTFTLDLTSGDGATTYASASSGINGDIGVWSYMRIWGPGQVRITNTNIETRVQGFVFDQEYPQGRLLCFELGYSGLVG